MFGRSAQSRVGEALEMAGAAQDRLNLFTALDAERSLSRAAEVDAVLEAGSYAGPLAGVPVAVKDLIDETGLVTTAGSAFYRHHAVETAPAIRRLEEAGAVMVGRTGLHEFAFGFSSENPHFGPVRNPWDPGTSPGGSSGGSAGAVAAAVTPIAVGTDTGGSIRVPAALCGCFGLKVSYGRIPLEGVLPLVGSVDTVGPIADSMEHLELAYRAMSGDDRPADPRPGLRLGIPQPWVAEAPTDRVVAQAFAEATGRLTALGHEVVEVRMEGVLPARELIYAIAEEVTAVHAPYRARGLPYGADVAARLDECAGVTSEEATRGRAWQQMIRNRFAEALAGTDFLITPTTPVMRKVIGVDTIGGRHYRSVLSWFTALVNHALLPALALPLAGTGAPPVSLQVIGPADSETGLIGLGRQLENAGVARFRPAPDLIGYPNTSVD